jgi:expansin (peptidoglycan-binding protein)
VVRRGVHGARDEQGVGDVGFESMKVRGPKGIVKLYADLNAPVGYARLLQMDTWAFKHLGDLINTADMDGHVKNAAMTWGVVVNPKDGLAYVNDDNNGLWIVRIEPKPVKKVIP